MTTLIDSDYVEATIEERRAKTREAVRYALHWSVERGLTNQADEWRSLLATLEQESDR